MDGDVTSERARRVPPIGAFAPVPPGRDRRSSLSGPAIIGAVVFGALAVAFTIPLFFETFAGMGSYWSELTTTGNRLRFVALIAGCGALSWACATRRAIEPFVLGLALVSPSLVWSVGSGADGEEGISALLLVRDLDEWGVPSPTWAFTTLAIARAGLLVALLAALLVSVRRLVRRVDRDGTARPEVDLWPALVGLGGIVASWSVSPTTRTSAGTAFAETALLEWRLLDPAPMIDQLLRLAFPALIALLVVAAAFLPAARRVRVWGAGAIASVVLALAAVADAFRFDVGPGYGVVEQVPTLASQLWPLAAALGFVAAAWIARSRDPEVVLRQPPEITWVAGTSNLSSSPPPPADG